MSTIKSARQQFGISANNDNNFHWTTGVEDGTLRLYRGGTDAISANIMHITSWGGVGIGVTEPLATLAVDRSISIQANGASDDAYLTFLTGPGSINESRIYSNESGYLFIDSLPADTGGIGINSNKNIDIYAAANVALSISGLVSSMTISNTAISLRAGSSERLRIGANGNIGIGLSTPTSKLDINGATASNIVAVAATDVDCSLGNYFTKTVGGTTAFTFSNVPASRAFSFVLAVTHTSGAITWPATVSWPGGTAPTLTTGKTHLFVFVTSDGGSTWRGNSSVNY